MSEPADMDDDESQLLVEVESSRPSINRSTYQTLALIALIIDLLCYLLV